MPEFIACPRCKKPVDPFAQRCPSCGEELNKHLSPVRTGTTGSLASMPGSGPLSTMPGTGPLPRLPGTGPLSEPYSPSVTPEILVPRLGDYLVEKRILNPKDLQRALDYQQKKSDMGHPRLLGRALIELGMLDRETLDQVITSQISSLHSALQEANRQLELRVQDRTQDLEWRLVLIQTAADITNQTISAKNLDELLKSSVELIIERLNYYHASIFMLDETGTNVILRASSGIGGKQYREPGYSIPVDTRSITTWVVQHREMRVANDVSQDSFYLKDELLQESRSEAGLPILIGEELIGVLDVQCTTTDSFAPGEMEVLQVIVNHISSVMQNLRLLEQAQRNLRETSLLYDASQQIAIANTPRDIYNAVAGPLHQAPYVSVILTAESNGLRLLWFHDPQNGSSLPSGGSAIPAGFPEIFPVFPEEIGRSLASSNPMIIDTANPVSGIPEILYKDLRAMKCLQAAFIPLRSEGEIAALLVLGSRQYGSLSQATLRLHASLAEMASTALEKVHAQENIEKRLTTLQTLDSISRSISMETSLIDLFRVLHEQITRVIGEINFMIALYDEETNSIEIPYAYEEDRIIEIPTIPLGEGLTSILIRTRQPLLLNEDTEKRATELGARVMGSPAKSWLGVPLLVGGKATGAIIVQDLEREHRFDEDDVRLLSNLAAQVAVSVRNARLLEETRKNAERERIVSSIMTRLWASTDMDTILRTAIQELGSNLKASKGSIRLDLDQSN
jgi:GAF domain-containing protein